MSNPPKKKGSAAEVAAGKWLTAEYDRGDLRIEGAA